MTDRKRCAIYTRKSTEEGLEQAFNSLDAQREACAAYVMSQAHEGWELGGELYDDGGWSGGNMDRPGLQQLLADVEAGKVDVIVVYKVDRLTRNLADFARIVDKLDKADASFVSVTQAFNTTTSMGRLTLNVLLSFAQFEREVTGERIRDKVAASKRKGMWMGGPVPLGYDLDDRKLLPHPTEAAQVRLIFERYVALRSISALAEDLAGRGIRTRLRTYRDGQTKGGIHFTKGPLALLLKNPIYLGKVRHDGELYEGEHEQIVPQDNQPDPVLLKLIAKARAAQEMVIAGKDHPAVSDYGKRHLWQLLRISWLAPDILSAIVEGRQPASLTGRQLLRATSIPLGWDEQRHFFGFT
ncbi:recombinase family protein [Erythrobacter alti]|uniref:recombinase family protein n=1 Tax=Erythrobacter alti TaxID=1896145 RepID=UPI0030F3D521